MRYRDDPKHPVLSLLLIFALIIALAGLAEGLDRLLGFNDSAGDSCGHLQGSQRRACIQREVDADYPMDY